MNEIEKNVIMGHDRDAEDRGRYLLYQQQLDDMFDVAQ